MAKSGRARRAELREGLLAQGSSMTHIAEELGRQFRVRPRVAWRYAMGWPQWKLVQEFRTANPELPIAESRVSEWEAWPFGGTKPTLEILGALALTFGHGCTIQGLVDDVDRAHLSPGETLALGPTQDNGEEPGSLPSVTDASERIGHAMRNPTRFAEQEVMNALRLQLDTAKVVDGRYGAAAALPSALGVVGGLRAVAPDIPDRHRTAALSLAAESAEFAGWLFRDLADTAKAAYWYDQATEYAQLCNDLTMQGYVLIRKAQMAYDARDGGQVRAFAQAILDGPWRLTGVLRAEAVLLELKGQLMCGNDVVMDDAVHRARDLSDGTGAILDVREAPCWTEAGYPDRAVELYDCALDDGSLSPRDRGFFTARRSAALALAGNPHNAAADALRALSSAGSSGSKRTEHLVRSTFPTLAARPDIPEVQQLAAALSHAR